MTLPLLLLFACSGSGTDTAGPADTAAAGSGTIAGTFDGRAFNTIGAAWRIGQPDDPEQTMVVYVFDNPIACADIADVAWDETVPDQTQSVEMKVVGTTAGDYPQADRTPGPGESDTNYTLTSTTGTPSETGATGGGVVLRENNRICLRQHGGLIAYLHAPAAVLQDRLRSHAGGRPSLSGKAVFVVMTVRMNRLERLARGFLLALGQRHPVHPRAIHRDLRRAHALCRVPTNDDCQFRGILGQQRLQCAPHRGLLLKN